MPLDLPNFLASHYPPGPYQIEETLATQGRRFAYRLRGPAGQYVVKLTDPQRAEALVRAELTTQAVLAAQHFPAPRPIPARDGQLFHPFGDQFVYLYEYLAGHSPRPAAPGFFTRLGALLARLHRLPLNADLPVSGYRPPALLTEARAQLQSIADPAQQPRTTELLSLIDRFPSFAALPLGIIHTDPYFSNLLETPAGQLILIDWDDAGVSFPLLDVGYVLAHLTSFTARDRGLWHIPGPPTGVSFRPEWAAEFLSAYTTVRPFTPDERALLPDAVRLSFLVYLCDWQTGELILDNDQRMRLVENSF